MTNFRASGCCTVSLGSVARIERSGIDAKNIKTGTLYVGLEHITNNGKFLGVSTVTTGELASTKFVFDSRHVLYGKLRPYLSKIARPAFEGICSTDILPILPGQKINRDYLFHFLRLPKMIDLATARCAGANLPRVSPKTLEDFEIPLPPLPEQKRIAAILDKVDALREKRRQTIAKLNTLLQAVFLDMFGDPVTNPKGWRISTFGDELEILQYGPRFYNQAYSSDGVRIVRITDLDALGNLNYEAMPKLEVLEADIKKYSLRQGDIIFARSGATVGKTALIPANAPTSIAGAYFIIMRFKKAIEPVYARTVLTNKAIQSIIASQSRQSAQQNFSGPSIRRLGLAVPPIDLQIRFRDFSAAVTKILLAQKEHEKRIASLCDSLTQRAFIGELFTDHEAHHALHGED